MTYFVFKFNIHALHESILRDVFIELHHSFTSIPVMSTHEMQMHIISILLT